MPKSRRQPHRQCKDACRNPQEAEQKVTLNIQVKETERRLCTLHLDENLTINVVRKSIIEGNRKVICKNLYIGAARCVPRMIVVFHDDEEMKFNSNTKLKSLGFRNGLIYNLTVRFVRALAILTQPKLHCMVDRVDRKSQGKYPRELIVQAVNMAPECTFDQTLSNLVNNATRVFESILQAECR